MGVLEAASFLIAHGSLKLIEPNAGIDRQGLALHRFETSAPEKEGRLSTVVKRAHSGDQNLAALHVQNRSPDRAKKCPKPLYTH